MGESPFLHEVPSHRAQSVNEISSRRWLRGLSRHIGLLVVLAVFIGLAVLFSLVVPITQGEDELAHYRYLSFIAQTGRLPATYAEREQAWYRADWPPLYHLLVGGAVRRQKRSEMGAVDRVVAPEKRIP